MPRDYAAAGPMASWGSGDIIRNSSRSRSIRYCVSTEPLRGVEWILRDCSSGSNLGSASGVFREQSAQEEEGGMKRVVLAVVAVAAMLAVAFVLISFGDTEHRAVDPSMQGSFWTVDMDQVTVVYHIYEIWLDIGAARFTYSIGHDTPYEEVEALLNILLNADQISFTWEETSGGGKFISESNLAVYYEPPHQ